MEQEILSTFSGRTRQAWEALLYRAGLTPDEDIDQTVLLWDGETLAAAGSRKGNLLKCIAVEETHQGDGLAATLLTALRQEAFREGFSHLFLYTKPENRLRFSSLFFYPVAKTSQVLLMETLKNGLKEFLDTLPRSGAAGTIGAVVMNCDPFTLGHRHLVETAARECAHVYAFILSEDKGFFSAAHRLEMVRRGTADLTNVTVLPTGPYLISAATFPTYFLKDRDSAGQIHCLLDIEIFARHFAPHFQIRRRYAGTEPLSPLTNRYNGTMAEHLPRFGIEFREVARLAQNGAPVSASAVRAYLQQGSLSAVRPLVPQSTFDFLSEHYHPAQEVCSC